MAGSEGLALAPWGVLGSGKIRTNAEEARRKESGEKGRMVFGPDWERTPAEKKVCDVLEGIAKEVGTESITARTSESMKIFPPTFLRASTPRLMNAFFFIVAIAYHLHKLPYVFPIIGGRKVEQLKENITALDISLTPEQMQRIEAAVPFNPGFPNDMIASVFFLL